MEQKLLTVISRRTAWIVLGVCIVFWFLLAAGFLEAPLGMPAAIMFLWMYLSLIVALASTLVAAGAVTALVLHRRGRAGDAEEDGLNGAQERFDAEEDLLDAAEDQAPDSPLRIARDAAPASGTAGSTALPAPHGLRLVAGNLRLRAPAPRWTRRR